MGVDPSHYVVERFGRSRNIRLGTFGHLADLALTGPFDLVVCADVVLYVSDGELRRGLDTIAEFRVLKDNYSAKYGVSGSAQVLVESKSGSPARTAC